MELEHLTCPECWTIIPVEPGYADQRRVMCRACGRVAAPGELVYQSSLKQLKSLPWWATNTQRGEQTVHAVGGASGPTIAAFVLYGLIYGFVLFLVLHVLIYRIEEGHLGGVTLGFILLAAALSCLGLWRAFVAVRGRIEVRISGEHIEFHTGLGRVGRTRSLRRSELVRITRIPRGSGWVIRVQTPKLHVLLGRRFPDERVNFLHALISTLRPNPGPCPHCFYDLRGTQRGDRCPECGKRSTRTTAELTPPAPPRASDVSAM